MKVNKTNKDSERVEMQKQNFNKERLEQLYEFISERDVEQEKVEEEKSRIVEQLNNLEIEFSTVLKLIKNTNSYKGFPVSIIDDDILDILQNLSSSIKKKNPNGILKEKEQEQVHLYEEIVSMRPTEEEILAFCRINKVPYLNMHLWDYPTLNKFKDYIMNERDTKRFHDFIKTISDLTEVAGYPMNEEYLTLLSGKHLQQIITECVNVCIKEFKI